MLETETKFMIFTTALCTRKNRIGIQQLINGIDAMVGYKRIKNSLMEYFIPKNISYQILTDPAKPRGEYRYILHETMNTSHIL